MGPDVMRVGCTAMSSVDEKSQELAILSWHTLYLVPSKTFCFAISSIEEDKRLNNNVLWLCVYQEVVWDSMQGLLEG